MRLMRVFLLTPAQLAQALDITIFYASTMLFRMWEQGYCARFPRDCRSYYYRLKEQYL